MTKDEYIVAHIMRFLEAKSSFRGRKEERKKHGQEGGLGLSDIQYLLISSFKTLVCSASLIEFASLSRKI